MNLDINKITIDMFGNLWDILFVDANDSRLAETSKILIGKCNSLTSEINIANNLPRPVMRKVVAHELTHAIISDFILNKDEFTQEEVCRLVESYFDFIYVQTDTIMSTKYE